MSGVTAFMESPLVAWVRTFSPGLPVDFQDLCDGMFLNDVLTKIDERASSVDLQHHAKDSNARIHNWALLLGNILGYYQDVLQQVVVAKLPNVVNIAKEPTKDSSLCDLTQVLLLLLGCAVQCPCKENFINTIKQMDLDLQEAMVEHIKQITDSQDNVVTLELSQGSETVCHSLSQAMRRVCQERDVYAQKLLLVTQEHDYFRSELEGKKGPLTPPAPLANYHVSKELTKAKTAINILEEDLEERARQLSEARDSQAMLEMTVSKLRQENIALSRDARSARMYRDELDMFKEKEKESVLMTEKYEIEIKSYKRRLNELDFFKTRVDELHEDNVAMTDARNRMEEKLNTQNRRVNSLMAELDHCQQTLEQVSKTKTTLEERVQTLVDENASLEFQCNNMKESNNSGLKRFNSYNSTEFLARSTQNLGLPISEELNDSWASKTMRLEMEKEEVDHELHEAKLRITEKQREIDQIKLEHTDQLAQKTSECHQQVSAVKRQVSELEKKVTDKENAHSRQVRVLQTELEKQKSLLVEQTRKAQMAALDTQRSQRTNNQQRERHWEEKVRTVREEMESKLRQTRQESDERIAKVEQEREELSQQLANHRVELLQHKQEHEQLQERNEELSVEHLSQKSSLAEVQTANQARIAQLQEAQMHSESRITQLQEEKAAEQRQVSRLQEECTQIQDSTAQRIAQLEKQLAESQSSSNPTDIDEARSTIAKLENEKKAMKEALESQLSLVRGELDTVTSTSEAQIRELRENVDTLRVTLKDVMMSESPRNGHTQPPVEQSSPCLSAPNVSESKLISATPFMRGYQAGRSSLRQEPASSHNNQSMTMPRMRHSVSTPHAVDHSGKSSGKKPRVKGVVQPQPRAPEYESDDSLPPVAFVRGSAARTTVAPGRYTGKMGGFSRDDRMRVTMPERKTVYVAPERRPESPASSIKSQSSQASINDPIRTSSPYDPAHIDRRTSVPSSRSSSLRGSPPSYPASRSGRSSSMSTHSTHSTCTNSTLEPDKENHILTSFQVVGTSTMRSKVRNGTLPRTKEQWKGLVDKVMELQNKNQQLMMDNTELRKTVNEMKFAIERLERIEEKNLELQKENMKLQKILDGIQGVGNPHDNRIYHYYSFV